MLRRLLIARLILTCLLSGAPVNADDALGGRKQHADHFVVPAAIWNDDASKRLCACRNCHRYRDPFWPESDIQLVGGIETVAAFKPSFVARSAPMWSAGIGFLVWSVVVVVSPWLLYVLLKHPLWIYSSALQVVVSFAWMAWVLGSSWFCWGQMIPQPFFVLSLFFILALATLYFVFICDLVEDHRLDQ